MAYWLNIDMEKLSSQIKATYLVLYDKANSYLIYDQPNNKKTVQEDKITDYKGYLSPEKYNNEENNSRLYNDGSMISQILTSYDDPIEITNNIYLGSAINATSEYVLQKCSIKMIINCAAEISNHFPKTIMYKKYSLYDDNINSIADDLESTYNDIITFQKDNGGSILVHCVFGRSRSVSVIIYYIMRTMKHNDGALFTFDEAIDFIKEKKPSINPTFRLAKDVIRAFKLLIERDKERGSKQLNGSEFDIEINASVYDFNSGGSIIDNMIENYEIKNNVSVTD